MRGPECEKALAELRVLRKTLDGCRIEVAPRTTGHRAPQLAHEQDALVKILGNLDSFRGESHFTTWAQKIAVRVAFTELRRKEWCEVSLQDLVAR